MNEPTATSDIRFSTWFKSSYSQPSESACVEIRFGAGHTGVRDSKAPGSGQLEFRGGAWFQFTTWLIDGRQSGPANL
ncbi:DUF397 domain-containing protein [Lentzea cavernae]|uniref:DUF397 domain-containing protein n=1 Tax=Lentzea cavernae TaxID=2020703 RepID=A0ABQ3MWX9_9PSEU|nr:DUF397 domain-containing protein [Lentzea cavernae]GHH62508.1 hypothetical protein GCM10017774_90480 [Lentzea cavernae]